MKRAALILWIFSSFAGSAEGSLSATDSEYWVEAFSTTRSAKLGETFQYILTAGAKNSTVRLPGDAAVFPGCQVTRYCEEDVSARHEGFTARQGQYTLVAFALDRVELPSLQVYFTWPQGMTFTASTRPLSLDMSSELPHGIRLKAPRTPWPPARDWVALSLFGIIGGLAGGGAWRFYRTHRRGAWSQPQNADAFRQLERLHKAAVFTHLQAQPYFISLSKILRRYVTARFEFPALELPRLEIVNRLKTTGLTDTKRRLLNVLLLRADLIKFAKAEVSYSHMIKAQNLARRFVSGTSVPIQSKRKNRRGY